MDNDRKQFLAPLVFAEETQGLVWVQAAPFDSWLHPNYGEIEFSQEVADQMKQNFDKNVRGQKVNTDYEHGLDPSKGTKASGWIEQVDVREDGMYVGINFTEPAKKEISDGEWKYFSFEFLDEWQHPQSREVHKNVLSGGGLTNKPWIKGLMPINFSEAMTFSVWSTAYINNLPDSSFLFIESGGNKDSDGKTTPRSNRHFPYKDANGKVDLPHLRNAIARIPQAGEWLSSSMKSKLQGTARNILVKQHSEEIMETEVKDEHAAEEHAEPGTGEPPQPRKDEDPGQHHEKGTREKEADIEKDIRSALDLDDDADVLGEVKQMFSELKPIRDAAADADEKRAFAEAYPAEAKRLANLEKADREHNAKAFAESYSNFEVDGQEGKFGFSSVALEKLEDLHKSFSEGSATISDLGSFVDSVAKTGLVEFSERGSSGSSELGETTDAAKAFGEKVAEVMENDKLSYGDAVAAVSNSDPELYNEYRKQVGAR